jgi:hypothetical protein
VAIGYRRSETAGQADQAYGVRLNPVKSDEIRFGKHDRVIVISES